MALIDNIEWHCKHENPSNTTLQKAGTHISLFFTWVIDYNLTAESLQKKAASDIEK